MLQPTLYDPTFIQRAALQHIPAAAFPTVNPVRWLTAHFAVGGWSPLQRLSGMLTAHMSRIAPRSGFTWHPHRGLEIYTWMLEGTLYHEDSTGGKGEIGQHDLQRMFSGDHIEHQELNPYDKPARVIQIWFMADADVYGVQPHYQQLSRAALPVQAGRGSKTYRLIGDGSPMVQHSTGRLSATVIEPGGSAELEAPRPGEDLFLYVTDGAGQMRNGTVAAMGQYDVVLARPDAAPHTLAAGDSALSYLSFYLPTFLP